MDDRVAKDAVIQAIEKLVHGGKRAYSQNVPNEAIKIVWTQGGGKITRGDASDRVKQAILDLQSEGKIEVHKEPYKDWKILN